MSRSMTTTAQGTAPAMRGLAISRPQQAALILTGTAGLICSILFGWLLVAPIIRIAPPAEAIWSVSLPAPDGILSPVGFALRDVQLHPGLTPPAAPVVEPLASRMERELGGFLDRHRGRPVIVSMAATCDVGGNPREAEFSLVTAEALSGEASGRMPLKELFSILNTRGKSSSKLLILDLAQAGPDRSLGLAAGDLAKAITQEIGSDMSIAVLLASAPGQISWVGEAQGSSVFAHYLKQSLDGRLGGFGRVSAGDLLGYVAPRVERWVFENRGGAIQTPVLLGNTNLQVALPRKGVKESPGAATTTLDPKVLADLMAEWKASLALAVATPSPYRSSPIGWRRYRNELLRAERLLRSGALEARESLDRSIRLRQELETPQVSPLLARPWSMALARTLPPKAVPADPVAFRQAVEDLMTQPEDLTPPQATKPPAEGSPKEEGAAKPDASNTPKAEAPAEKPTAPLPSEKKVRDSAPTESPYVEGQVPFWYRQFVTRGAELPGLRERRLALVKRAFALREALELACTDDRIVRWIRTEVDAIDAIRRNGQDLIFSGEQSGLSAANGVFTRAENQTASCTKLAADLKEALDLLDRLEADLPFHAECIARGQVSLEDEFREILAGTVRLAMIVNTKVGDSAIEASRRDALIKESKELLGNARAFERSIEQNADRLKSSTSWREIDALLCLPTLDPPRRQALIEQAGSEAVSPSFPADVVTTDSKAAADPAFWRRAVHLAEVEAALLIIAGVEDLDPELVKNPLKSRWEKDAAAADEELAKLSARFHGLKSRMLSGFADLGGEAGKGTTRHSIESAYGLAPLDSLGELLTASLKADDPRLYGFVAWQGMRLSDDFAGQQAWTLLTEVRQNSRSPQAITGLAESIDLSESRLTANLKVGLAQNGRLSLYRDVPVPAGLAVAFVPPGPIEGDSRVIVTGAGETKAPSRTLLEVPRSDPQMLVLTDENGELSGSRRPVVFYRGKFFAPEVTDQGIQKELVSVKMRQQSLLASIDAVNLQGKVINNRTVEVKDQFIHNRDRAFLHPGLDMGYKLVIKNLSDRKLTLRVTHGLDLAGLQPLSQEITLASGQTDESLTGTVSSADLVENVEKNVNVKVIDQDNGTLAAKPLAVPFKKIKPSAEFIKQEISYVNGQLKISVTHLPTDPVTSPLRVVLTPEPLNAYRQTDNESFYIPLGVTRTHTYRIFDRNTPKLSWVITVDGQKILEDSIDIAAQEAKPLSPPPAAPPTGGEKPGGEGR